MANIGQVIGDRYELLQKIGQGGMSAVYLAVDRANQIKWAVKEIATSQDASSCHALEEARLMQGLNHPRIPSVKQIIEGNPVSYVIMEYLSGKTAQEVVREEKKFSYRAALQIGIQLCEVLEYLHTLPDPVIFRDVKPGNIMLVEQNPPEIRLLDFGIALLQSQSQNIQAVGTRGFAAPEQFIPDRPEDAGTDIYAIGTTLYYLVTGKILERTSSPFLEDSRSETPARLLQDVILKCTMEKPEERYRSCEEVKRELEQCLTLASQPGAAIAYLSSDQDPAAEEMHCTVKLDQTVSLEGENQGNVSPVEKARKKLQFRPLRKVLVCGTEDEL